MDWSKLPSTFYRVSLKVFVFDDKKRLLLCKSPDNEWEPPGGGWEYGESIHKCLNRELHEELGIKIKTLGNVVAVYRGVNKRGFRSIKIAFEAELENHNFEYGDKVETRYVSKDELLLLSMSTDEIGIKKQVNVIWPE